MKENSINRKEKVTIIASSALTLYALYEIIKILLVLKQPSFDPVVNRLLSNLFLNIGNLNLLAFGLCGLVLVYAYISKDRDLEFQNKLDRNKKIVFFVFLILTVFSFIRFIYLWFESYRSFQNAITQGTDFQGNETRYILFTVAFTVIGLLGVSSKILFGTFLLSNSSKLVKPLLVTCFASFAFTAINIIYQAITGIWFYANVFNNTSGYPSFGSAERQIYNVFFDMAGKILVLVTSLVIVLYVIREKKPTKFKHEVEEIMGEMR